MKACGRSRGEIDFGIRESSRAVARRGDEVDEESDEVGTELAGLPELPAAPAYELLDCETAGTDFTASSRVCEPRGADAQSTAAVGDLCDTATSRSSRLRRALRVVRTPFSDGRELPIAPAWSDTGIGTTASSWSRSAGGIVLIVDAQPGAVRLTRL